MWIKSVLENIPQWAWAEVQEGLVPYDEAKHEATNIQIPEDVRPVLVARYLRQNEALAAELMQFENSADRPDPVWCMEQVTLLDALLAVELRHAGITLDAKCVIGKDWKIMKLRESLVIIPDEKMMRLMGSAELAAAAAVAARGPVRSRSTIRFGQ